MKYVDSYVSLHEETKLGSTISRDIVIVKDSKNPNKNNDTISTKQTCSVCL